MKNKVNSLMLQARKAKDAAALLTYQAIIAAFQTAEKENGIAPTAVEEIAILRKMVTSRLDVIKVYEKEGRTDLADIEANEATIIGKLIPKLMDQEEAKTFIVGYLKGSTTELIKRNMGVLVKESVAASAGFIDGKTASGIISKLIEEVND